MGSFTEPGGARDGYEHRLPDTEAKRAALSREQTVAAIRAELPTDRPRQHSVYLTFADWVTAVGMLDRCAGTDKTMRRIVDTVQIQVSRMRPDRERG